MREELNANVQIRRAAPGDAASTASLLHRSFVEYEASYTPEAFAATICTPAKILERLSEGPGWVALKDDAVVGTMSAVAKGERLYIRGMAVDPTARGSRIGQRLLECAERFAVENGLRELFLSTTPFLSRAIRLYEQYGFCRNDEGPDSLFGTPLFTMVKALGGTPERTRAELENLTPGDEH